MAIAPALRRVRLQLEELEARDLPSSAALVGPSEEGSFATDRILVRWVDDAPVAAPFVTATDALGNNTYSIQLADGVSVSDALAWYEAQAGVDFAQRDAIIATSKTANDYYASQQWALSAIGAPTAWDYTTGSSQIIVAVVDTGVDYNHPDLAANIWKNTGEIAGNGRDDDGNGYTDDYYGYNFNGANSNPMDDNGHGTHVAGTIGAIGNNSTGAAGINWNVRIMSLKFMSSSGSGYTSAAVQAINYAVRMGAKVINNSWGGGTYDQALATAIQYAQSRGVIVVNAAGNNGVNVDSSPSYPASLNGANVLTVAATDQNGNLASFSNYGAGTVDIAAPGVTILSTYTSGRYAYMSGTSMATPHVAGAAALLWSRNPSWNYSQVINALLSSTTASANLFGKVGAGVLNIGRAVQVSAAPTTPGQGPTVTSHPANQSTGVGGAATFAAAASNATSIRWQVSTDGGVTWTDLSNSAYYSGVNTGTLRISNALTTMSGQYRAVFGNASGLTSVSASAQLFVTSSQTYTAYVQALYSYHYAYYAYVTGGGQHAYNALVNAWLAYYYANYAHYYNSIGNSAGSLACASYAAHYSYQANYYSYYAWATTGNAYAYYAYYYAYYSYAYSNSTANGY